MPANLHTIVLSLTLDSYSATTWRNTWSFIMWRIHISVLGVANDSSPGTINSDTWRVMLGTIHISVLCVTRNSSPETTYRDTWKVMLWIINIHVLCVSRNSSPSTTQRNTLTGIMEYSISLFCLISKKMVCKREFSLTCFLVQLLQEIFSFGNVLSRQKTSWEYPATQSLQDTIVCCWWKWLKKTFFVYD